MNNNYEKDKPTINPDWIKAGQEGTTHWCLNEESCKVINIGPPPKEVMNILKFIATQPPKY